MLLTVCGTAPDDSRTSLPTFGHPRRDMRMVVHGGDDVGADWLVKYSKVMQTPQPR